MAEEIVESLQQEPSAPPPERVPINETPADGPGSGRGAIRKELEKSVESARKAEQKQERPARQAPRGRGREHIEEMQEQEAAPAERDQEQAGEQEQEAPEIQAPAGWTKEAKAEWSRLPSTVQAAVAKRETDMAKGVEDLKKSYADVDAALKPRMELIRSHGHTAGQAVNQLFAWFEALSANPVESFPALARSFNFDLRRLPGMQPAAAPAPAQPAAQPGQAPAAQDEVPPYIKSIEEQINELKNSFGQQINMLGTNFQQASQEKTNEILMAWSKDKPYFEDVRRMMGHLISSGAVQPLPNGNADLDNAYDMAVYAMPEVRAKVLADQQAKAEADRKAKAEAEKKAQQAAADKARRTATSLIPGAPGTPASGQPQRKKGKSVRESIMEARQELSE